MRDKQLRRPYKNQKQKDTELMLAYHAGILDERKEWGEKQKEFNKKLYLIKRQKGFCFCMGEKRWKPFCAECQEHDKKLRQTIISNLMKEWILTNNKNKTIEDFFVFFGEEFKEDLQKIKFNIKNITSNVNKTNKGGKE